MKTQIRSIIAGALISAGTVIGVNAATFTATTSGNWSDPATWGGSAPGTNITIDQVIIPSGLTVTLDADITFNGLLSSLEVNGTLNSGTGNSLTFEQGLLSGNGAADLEDLTFEGLSTMTFSGSATIDRFNTSSIALNLAAMVTIEDSLRLNSGTLTITTGANLTMSTSTDILVDDGTLAVSGGLFTASDPYNVTYIGSSKNTGVEAFGSGLNDLKVMLTDNSATLTLTTDVMVAGHLEHQTGIFSIGANDLTIGGNYTAGAGALINGDIAAKLIFETAAAPTSPLNLTNTNPVLGTLDVNITSGTLTLATDLTIQDDLFLHSGDLTVNSGANLVMAASSDIVLWDGELLLSGGTFNGSLAYNVTYYNGSHTSTSVELSGVGLNDLMIDLNAETDSVVLQNDVLVGGELSLQTGTLSLNGSDVTLNGSYDIASEGWIAGSSASDLTFATLVAETDSIRFAAGKTSLAELTINFGTAGNLVIVTDLNVQDLTLTTGGVHILDNKITVSGSITGYDATDYVLINGDGALIQSVTMSGPYVVFPVGTNTGYSPANVQITAGATNNVEVGVKNDVLYEGYTGNDNSETASVVDRTWKIITPTGVTSNLQLQWLPSAEVNGFQRSDSYITHYNGSDWDIMPTSAATSVAGGMYQQVRTGNTLPGLYVVTDENAMVSVEENEGVEFNVFPNPVTSILHVRVNINEPVKMEVIDMNGRLMMVQPVQNSAGFPAQYDIDMNGLPVGTYLVRITGAEQVFTRTIIKS